MSLAPNGAAPLITISKFWKVFVVAAGCVFISRPEKLALPMSIQIYLTYFPTIKRST